MAGRLQDRVAPPLINVGLARILKFAGRDSAVANTSAPA
jgi:hypothetical protein